MKQLVASKIQKMKGKAFLQKIDDINSETENWSVFKANIANKDYRNVPKLLRKIVLKMQKLCHNPPQIDLEYLEQLLNKDLTSPEYFQALFKSIWTSIDSLLAVTDGIRLHEVQKWAEWREDINFKFEQIKDQNNRFIGIYTEILHVIFDKLKRIQILVEIYK